MEASGARREGQQVRSTRGRRYGPRALRRAVGRFVRIRVAVLADVLVAVLVSVFVCLPTTACAAPRAEAPRRPNVILVVADDLGQQDVSVPMLDAPSDLNRRFRTPNLELLAARGVRFASAYAAAPVCTPSRTAILSGQSPARTRITYWTLDKDRDTSAAHPRLDAPDWNVNGLAPSGAELPALLARAGYRTIHVGKAHFGARGAAGADPRALGFEVNVAGHAAGAPGSFLGRDHFKDAARKSRGRVAPSEAAPSVWDVPGLERWHGQDVWLDDVLAREAGDAIAASVAERRPFFLHFCPYGVHVPIMPDARFSEDPAYAALDATERAYASMVAAVDDALGTILARCAELGVLDETVVLFTSDNGGLSAHGRGAAPDGSKAHAHNAPLRSGKGSAYEGGLRVPLVIAGPGVEARAAPVADPVVGTDLYPTILGLAGVAVPAGRACDGLDLGPLLRPDGRLPTRDILFHQPHAWGPDGPGIEPFSAIRRGSTKLIWFHDPGRRPGGPFELYDLAADPGERRDLAEIPDGARILGPMVDALRVALSEAAAQGSRLRSTGADVGVPRAGAAVP